MQFFRATNGHHYPVSAITEVQDSREVIFTPGDRKGRVTRVLLGDHGGVDVHDYDVRSILNTPSHIWPSQAGTYIVSKGDEEDGGVHREPVLGWAHSTGGDVQPVSFEGVNGFDEKPKAVLLPDGTVVDSFGARWESLSSWQEEGA